MRTLYVIAVLTMSAGAPRSGCVQCGGSTPSPTATPRNDPFNDDSQRVHEQRQWEQANRANATNGTHGVSAVSPAGALAGGIAGGGVAAAGIAGAIGSSRDGGTSSDAGSSPGRLLFLPRPAERVR